MLIGFITVLFTGNMVLSFKNLRNTKANKGLNVEYIMFLKSLKNDNEKNFVMLLFLDWLVSLFPFALLLMAGANHTGFILTLISAILKFIDVLISYDLCEEEINLSLIKVEKTKNVFIAFHSFVLFLYILQFFYLK